MSSPQQQFNYDLIFLAVSAKQLDRPPSKDPRVTHLKDVMIENRMTLIDARNHGLFGGGIPIFESGASTAKQVRFTIDDDDLNHGNLLPRGVVELVASIINFFTAVSADADVFIGVRGSTFSTDVFAVRYYLSKEMAELHGSGNYIVQPGGIIYYLGVGWATQCSILCSSNRRCLSNEMAEQSCCCRCCIGCVQGNI